MFSKDLVDVSGNAFSFGTNGNVLGFTSEFSLGPVPGSAPGAPQASILRSKASLAPGGALSGFEHPATGRLAAATAKIDARPVRHTNRPRLRNEGGPGHHSPLQIASHPAIKHPAR